MSQTIQRITMVLVGAIIAITSVLIFSTQQAGALSWRERRSIPNIAETAIGVEGEFDTLVAALQCTGLDKVVSSKWVRLTVFAPTDAAFEKLELNSDNVCSAFSKRDLRNILLYHVTWGTKDSSEVLSRNSLRMLNWQRAKIDATVPSIANAELNTALLDIKASNGIIHVVNDVMLPRL